MGGSHKRKVSVWLGDSWWLGVANGNKDKIINFMFNADSTQLYLTQTKASLQTDQNIPIVDYGVTGFC